MPQLIDARQFLDQVIPAIAAGDPSSLARIVRRHWRLGQLCQLLSHPHVNVRRVAAIALGMVGNRRVLKCLTRALKDPDEQVAQMAEHALWSIWFRSGSPQAAQPFRQGVLLLGKEAYQPAIEYFRIAAQIDPQFAEAFNQCAIAHFFLFQWEEALACCRRTLKLIPTHFGAVACMGHCYTQMGELRRALSCYQRALAIHPRLSTIAAMVQRLQEYFDQTNNASGCFQPEPAP